MQICLPTGLVRARAVHQVQTATYVNGLWYVNGGCSSSSPGQNSVTGTVSGSNISLTFNEGGNVFTGQGTVSGTTVSGSYSETARLHGLRHVYGNRSAGPRRDVLGDANFNLGSTQATATLTEGTGNSLTVQTT